MAPAESDVPLPEQFRVFADSCERDRAWTYAAICRSVGEDAALSGLMAEAPPNQRRPNLLLAAVHFLLLSGSTHPLSAYYDTVAEYRDTEVRWVAPAGDVGEVFKDFCMTHAEPLLGLIATGSTQTNEVGRCTGLLPALSLISAQHGGEPLGLLDLGTSAGLLLQFARYGYSYRQRPEGRVVMAGDVSSAVQLECAVHGDIGSLPLGGIPPVVSRAGLDRSPIDPHDADATRWLLACLWPDHLPRFTRLRAALDIARTDPDAPVLHQGDMVDELAPVAAGVAPNSPLVIFHSWVAAYLTPERQGELVAAVQTLAAGSGRPVHYVYAESPEETPGLPTPPSPDPGPNSHIATVLVHVGPGGTPERWADMHHHGRSIRWWMSTSTLCA